MEAKHELCELESPENLEVYWLDAMGAQRNTTIALVPVCLICVRKVERNRTDEPELLFSDYCKEATAILQKSTDYGYE